MHLNELENVKLKLFDRQKDHYDSVREMLCIKSIEAHYKYYGICERFDPKIGTRYYIVFATERNNRTDAAIIKDGYGRYNISFSKYASLFGLSTTKNINLIHIKNDNIEDKYVIYEIEV